VALDTFDSAFTYAWEFTALSFCLLLGQAKSKMEKWLPVQMV